MDSTFLTSALPFVFCISFFAVASLMPRAIKLALKHGFVDEPGGRKTHEGNVPPIGGLVVFAISILILTFSNSFIAPLFVALILLLAVGAIDDYRGVKPWLKFGAQLLAASLIVLWGDARLYQLGNLFGFGDVGLDLLSIPFSILAIVLLINALNLMDGLDGLGGGLGVVMLFWLGLGALFAGQGSAALPIFCFIGGLGGFLVHNMRYPGHPRAQVFLGDAGSMSLGLILAWFAIKLGQEGSALPPVVIAWILALPVMDATAQFIRRLWRKKHPFTPDRGHLHHHILDADLPVGWATIVILLVSFLTGGLAYGLTVLGLPHVVLTILWGVLFGAMIFVSLRPAMFVECVSSCAQYVDKSTATWRKWLTEHWPRS